MKRVKSNLGSVDGDVSLQCEKGDVNVFFSSTDLSTIRVQEGLIKYFIFIYLKTFISFR
jgi:hypothetical protein